MAGNRLFKTKIVILSKLPVCRNILFAFIMEKAISVTSAALKTPDFC